MQGLLFSYGVEPVYAEAFSERASEFVNNWLREHRQKGNVALLVAAASPRQPDANHRIEFMRIGELPAAK